MGRWFIVGSMRRQRSEDGVEEVAVVYGDMAQTVEVHCMLVMWLNFYHGACGESGWFFGFAQPCDHHSGECGASLRWWFDW